MKTLSQSLETTHELAHTLLNTLQKGSAATIVALQGDLGAGKTSFTQEAGKILGVTDNMHSPTFVIMKIYEIDFKGFKRLVHIDAYRLEKEEELLHLGWEELATDPENLIFIEWPENVQHLIPQNAHHVSLRFVDEKTREIDIDEKV